MLCHTVSGCSPIRDEISYYEAEVSHHCEEIEHNRHYLFGRPLLLTDHHSLCYLKMMMDLVIHIAIWVMKLQEFDYTIV